MQNDVAGVDIHEWQARAHDSDRHDGLLDRSVAARLCDGILTLFQEAIRQISRQDQVPKPVRTRLERSYGFIALWSNGYGIRDGNLDDVFAKSRTIRRSTLRILSNITNALLNRLIPLTKISSDALDTLAVKLAAASAEASYIIHDADDGSSSDASSDVFSDPGLDSVSEIAEDLKTDAQCLMELDPLFKAPILSNHSQQKQAAILEWGPEKAYCDKVQQRFPEAEASLVTRLGEANWERYLRCQKMRDQREIELESEADAAPEIPGSGRQAVALAPDYGTIAASSKFHDSGLGTSLPASSSYAETVMTYSGAEGQKIHVPRLSEEAKQGKPFPCVACGGRLVRITNNSAWKRHLYMDLQPYHCLEAGCAKFSFHNRNSWVSHLALEHHYEPDWKPITCPLCLETTEKGKLAVTTHLARHLEEISLSALPACPDEEESDTSSESVADDGASVVSDAAGASQPAMKSVTFYPKDVGQYLDGDVPPPFHINIYRDIHDSVEDFRDTNMPDIFRFAHPRIYDKDKNCHSDHRDISTLVRHLSRPAHRLHVTERFVSSFDVNDQAYPHPRLGLCRLCWRAFPERDTFDDHISHACARVSKGRREKWRILLETFTPLNQHSGVSEESDHASTITRRLIDHFSKHSAQAKIAWDSSNTVWFEDDNHNRFTPNYENFRDNMKVHVWTTPEDDEEPNLVETPAQFGSLAAWLNHLAPEARDKVAALPRKEQEKLMAEWKDTVYRRNPFDNGVKKVILELLDSERIGRAYCTNITIVETPDDIRDRVYGYFLRKGYLNPDTGAYPSRLAFELGPGINLSYENFMHDSTVLVRVMDESEYLSRQLQEQEDRIKRYREANSNKRASTPSPAPPSRPSVDPLPRSWPRDKKSMESHMDESEKKGDSYYREIRYMRCICEHDNFLTDTIFNWPAEEWEAIDVNEAARFLIQCDQCGAWQHGVCMGLRPSDGIPSGYLCEECRPELHEQHYEGKFGRSWSRYIPMLPTEDVPTELRRFTSPTVRTPPHYTVDNYDGPDPPDEIADELGRDDEFEVARAEAERLQREEYEEQDAIIREEDDKNVNVMSTEEYELLTEYEKNGSNLDVKEDAAREEAERLQREEYEEQDALLRAAAAARGTGSNLRWGDGASNLPSLNTNISSGLGGASGSSHPGLAHMQAPQHPQRQPLQHQQDPQPQQSTYFHHWQPPRSHANFRMDELDPDGEIEAARQEEAERLRRENHDQESAPLQGQTRMPGTGTGTNPRRRGVAVRRYDDDGDDEIQVARQEAERLQREEYGHEDALLQVAASRAMAHGLDSNNFDLGDGFSDPYSEEERVLEDERREQEEWYLAEEAEHVREQELWEEQRVEDELREMEEREIAETYSSSEGSDEDEDDEDDSDRDGSVESDDE